MTIKLMVDYPAELNLDGVIESLVGHQCDGAGSGFGRRDMDWHFDDDFESVDEAADAASNAADRVREHFGEDSTVQASVYDSRDDD